MLLFETFARAQAARLEFFHPPGTRRWTFSDWGNAMAGECGEACNVGKKLTRAEDGVAPPSQAPREVLLESLGEELADTVTYAFSLAAHAGLDLEEHIVRKFNKVSEERECSVRLGLENGMVVVVGLPVPHSAAASSGGS